VRSRTAARPWRCRTDASSPSSPLREARVAHLYVDPEHWRQAIGGALLRRAQAVRPRGLDLWVFQRNTVAIAFHERHGFRIAELTDGSGNEEREPDARMVWP